MNKENTNKVGGDFIIKTTSASEIFTTHDFSDEQKMMAKAVEEYVDKEIWPNKPKFEKRDFEFTLQKLKECGELGILGPSISQEYGGLGMGFTTAMLVCDKISGATGSLGTAYGAHTGIGILPIYLYGNEEQRKTYLPKMVSGEWIGAYCLTEPSAGSDANSGKATAKLSDDGKHYIINGQKMWISNAGYAEVFIVFARIEDDKNITAFIVEKSKVEGLTLGEEEHKLGIKASSTRQVFFENTKIPVDNLLGKRNEGFKLALNVLNVGRIKLAAASLDAQIRNLNYAIDYANQRIQFKLPISKFGAIQEKIADVMTNAYVSHAACYRAAHDIEEKIAKLESEGLDHQTAELKGVEDYAAEAAILKVWCSEAAQHCTDEAIQILGGMGFSEETAPESAWRDARITRIYEGTNEINRLLIVSLILKKGLKGQIDLLTPAKEVAAELTSVPSFESPDFSAPFAIEHHMLYQLKKVLLLIAGKATQKFALDLEKHEELLLRIANIGIEIYMAESTILAAEKNSDKPNAEYYKAMSQLNLYKATNKIRQAGEEAILYLSESDEQKMMLMGLKRFTKYPEIPNQIKLQKFIAQKLIDDGKAIS